MKSVEILKYGQEILKNKGIFPFYYGLTTVYGSCAIQFLLKKGLNKAERKFKKIQEDDY